VQPIYLLLIGRDQGGLVAAGHGGVNSVGATQAVLSGDNACLTSHLLIQRHPNMTGQNPQRLCQGNPLRRAIKDAGKSSRDLHPEQCRGIDWQCLLVDLDQKCLAFG
jgi:hypothetical protein